VLRPQVIAPSTGTKVRDLLSKRRGRVVATFPGLLLAFAVAGAVLPNGLPLGVVLLGGVLGSLSALTSMGLVLVYRSSRVINFAQAELGGLAGTVGVIAVAGWGLPYLVALPVGLVVAMGTGALVDLVVVRRFFTAPRLILTVATLGVAQLLGALQIALPAMFTDLKPLTTFTTPFKINRVVGPIVFTGDHVVAGFVVAAVLCGLAYLFARTDLGVAIRGVADSTERALLLGIPVRRLSLLSWIVAAGLSGLGAMLSAPILGPNLGIVAGPVTLLAPLTAAVLARMENLVVAFLAALSIGIVQQAVFWSYPRSSAVDVGLFAVVMVALLLRRKEHARPDDAGLGGHVAVREVKPIPLAIQRLPEVRIARVLLRVLLVVVVLGVPPLLSGSRQTLAAFICIYGIIAISLVILTGWAGQISLGQFAFVGAGAATAGGLIVTWHVDALLACLAAAAVGAVAAVIIGVPALRIPGLFLAVATLAFAVPVSTYLLSSIYFPALTPSRVPRPPLFGRVDLNDPLAFYFFCLAGLVVAYDLTRNVRKSRVGRAIVAVRDNDRGAASYSISPTRAKLTAFSLAGGLAGFAGGLYVLGVRGIAFSGFDPQNSVQVFTMVVVGGLGSLPGALLGAVYVQGVQFFLHGAAQLLATGVGLLGLLLVLPGGLGQAVFNVRDRLIAGVARRHGLEGLRDADAVVPTVDGMPEAVVALPTGTDGALLRCAGVDAGYGQVQVLFDVALHVDEGETVALLGTNGAGKSTILRVVSGLMRPQAGRVCFAGDDVTDWSPADRIAAGLVTVPGGRGVFGSLTVRDNLRLAAWTRRREFAFVEATMDRIFDLFPPLKEREQQKGSALSGGEQQMLTIAQALLCKPRLLLIDELSLGLAPTVVARLLDVVREMNRDGVTVLVVEQSVNVAVSIAERAVFMEKGAVRFTGATAELTERPDLLRAVFLESRAPARTRPALGLQETAAESPRRFEVENVRRRFGGVVAIDDVSLDVDAGNVLGIIGSNGAGKTTLFDICSGFLPPDDGRVLLDGVDVTDVGAPERAALGMGRVFQSARLFPSLTVPEAIAVALERHVAVRDPFLCLLDTPAAAASESAVRDRVDELIAEMRLEGYRDAFISELSTGTRRIVELACIMAHEPKVLLLDEPSSGIAQRECEALGELLLDIRERTGTTMVVIEHDMPLVSSIADELVCLHLGRVIARGTPRAVLSDEAVLASYLGSDDATVRRSGARSKASDAAVIDDWLPIAEYAARIGTTRSEVRRQIREGELEAHRNGSGYQVRVGTGGPR
jgi:ABC-type branched-subunit amino acid transport system ATPase component/ABC-type branched-subunit amino acid transport system permease subunit